MGFYNSVHEFPLLEDDEEQQLWADYRSIDYTDLAEKAAIKGRIITSHLRMCASEAAKYTWTGLSFSGMFSSAEIGLLQAFHKFDHTNGNKFSTYAGWYTKAGVQEYVFENISPIRSNKTAFQKVLFSKYAKALAKATEANPDFNHEQLIEVVAQGFIDGGQSTYDLKKTMAEIRLHEKVKAGALSLDAPRGDDEMGFAWIESMDSKDPTAEDVLEEAQDLQHLRRFLEGAPSFFTDREWEILKARKLQDPPQTLEELSGVFDISRERVRQIEVKAYDKLIGMAREHFRVAVNDELDIEEQKTRATMRIAAPRVYISPTPSKVNQSVSGEVVPKPQRRIRDNKVRDAYLRFKETGALTPEERALLKEKYQIVSGGSAEKRIRNWEIFSRKVLQGNPDAHKELVAEFSLKSSHISTIVRCVDEKLLQTDPFMPSDEYLLFLHQKYLENNGFQEDQVDRNWDIWLRRTMQQPCCKSKIVGRIYGIDHTAVSVVVRKMNDFMGGLMDEFPEDSMPKDNAEIELGSDVVTSQSPVLAARI